MRRHSITALAAGFAFLWLVSAAVAAEIRPGLAPAPVSGAAGPDAKAATPDTPATGPGPASAVQPFIYRSEGKSDPFKPFIEISPASQRMRMGQSPILKGRPISPLQQIEIDQFRLVGIAVMTGNAPQSWKTGLPKDTIPSCGAYIGLNEGRVASILPDRVIVEERVQAGIQKGRSGESPSCFIGRGRGKT